MLPKKNRDNLPLREKIKGDPRVGNMPRMILESKPNFPIGVELKDIDASFIEWVENSLYIAYKGKELPTFRLFSNQRINEYSQSWKHLDENGNLMLNFKVITRENNPKHGESQGSWYNIPGNRSYPLFVVPVEEESGQHYYEMYSMKQPFACDLTYTLSLVTNHYELLNIFNEMVLNEFKAFECYIRPNGHYMPMSLNDVTDSSEYAIDDRKYYAQEYSIKIKAYIIREEDFEVTQLPTKVKIRIGAEGEKRKKAKVYVEEDECQDMTDDGTPYDKILTYHITEDTSFTLDSDIVINEVNFNGNNPKICINGEPVDWERHCQWYEDDVLSFENVGTGVTIKAYDARKT